MKKITSIDNLVIKRLKKLQQKKYRKEFSSFVVENFVIVRDAFMAGFEIKAIFVTEDFLKSKKFAEIKNKIIENKVFLIDKKINKFVSDMETPSGIIAEYSIKEHSIDTDKPIIYLNGISDPGNLGTIFRTCLAFGFENILCDEKCADVYNQKTISAAKDAIFKLNILKDKNCEILSSSKLPIYIADAQEGLDVSNFSFPDNYFLVFGSESHGIDSQIKELAKDNLKINISEKIESLNVSNALAIFLYEIKRK